MSKNPASRSFWRNVTLIALAHVVLIAGFIRWSLAARSAPDAESLVWLSGAEDLVAEKSESSAPPPTKISVPSVESEPLRTHEEEPEQSPLTQARSEIELPKPTPIETPVPKATPRPKATTKPTPKPTPRSTPKKAVLAKVTKSSAHAKPSSPKSKEEKTDASNEKKQSAKTTGAKSKSSSDTGSEKTGSASKAGDKGGLPAVASAKAGGSSASEFGWYGNMLHDRFYSAWIQPTTNVPSGTKISTLVKVRIEKDGRVSKFEIIKPSQNVVVNESIRVVAKQVTQVDPPPAALATGDHYDVKINFELNTDQAAAK